MLMPIAAPTPAATDISVLGSPRRPVQGDPIFAVNDEFRRDTRPDKANLGIGVYCDELGRVPVLASVREAARQLAEEEEACAYLPVEGFDALRQAIQALLFGGRHEAVASRRVATLQTVGASGALRLAGELLATDLAVPGIWVSDPSWHNHRVLFEGAGLFVGTYPYLDANTGGLRFEALLSAMAHIPERGVVLLHGCCHNPTGVDLDPAQWAALAQEMRRRRLIPFIDLAYQGFGSGVEDDAAPVRCLAEAGLEFLVAQTFSKNFSLYGERCGSLSVVAGSAREAEGMLQQMKAIVSRFYFSPPARGARLVAKVLQTPALAQQWVGELTAMRERVDAMRSRLVAALQSEPAPGQWAGLAATRGMFAYPSLTPRQVNELKRRHGVYLAPTGRLCIAALNNANIERVVQALRRTVCS
jgi:aromatic-amino-acid transaminase